MPGGNVQPSLDQAEHIGAAEGENIEAKRVGLYGFGTDDNWKRTPLPLIDVPYDTANFSDPDANGNYQTITFKVASDTVRTLALAFDVNGQVTSITRS